MSNFNVNNPADINQTFIIEPMSITGGSEVLSGCTGVYTNNLISCSGNTQINLGYGVIEFTGIISANTINGGTFYGDGSNLTGISVFDVFVTGGTYSAGTAVYTNNTGGTFSVSGFSTSNDFTGGTVSGATLFTGGLTADTISASTYLGLSNLYYPLTGNPSNFLTQEEVLEYPTFTDFPATGLTNIIYLAVDTSITYAWNGLIYIPTSQNSGIRGIGTINRLSKFISGTTIGNSNFTDSGSAGASYVNGTQYISFIPNGSSVITLGRAQSFINFALGNPGSLPTTIFSSQNQEGLYLSSNGDIRLLAGGPANNPATRLHIDRTSGNINITSGSTIASERLQVTGNLRVTGAYLDSNNSSGSTNQYLKSTITGTTWTTISASTDVFVTGGTYSAGTAVYTNNTGGTFSVSGFSTGTTTPNLQEVLIEGDRPVVIVESGYTFISDNRYQYLVFVDGVTSGVLNAGVFPLDTELVIYSLMTTNLTLSGTVDEIIGDFILKPNTLTYVKRIVDEVWLSKSIFPEYIPPSVVIPTLQQILDNNHDLVNNNNYQGTSAGVSNTGNNVNAFGDSASSNNNGSNVNAIGQTTARNNTGNYVNAFLGNAASGNTGNNVNAFGFQAALGNIGSNVNAYGNQTGQGNLYSNVNLFGPAATADQSSQTVFNTGAFNARLSYATINADRKWDLPNKSGTIALTSDITTFTGGSVTGATRFTNGLTANTISATTYFNLPLDVYTTGGTYSNGTAVYTNSTGGTFSVSGFSTSTGGSFTGGTVSGATYFTNGVTANTFSATTLATISGDVQTQIDKKLNISACTATGLTIAFTTDKVYGTLSSPETGTGITASVSGGLLGVCNIIIHSGSTTPTFSSEFKKLSGSGSYSANTINYIFNTFITSTEIIYAINQRT